MHEIPALSALTAITALFVTVAIFYIGYPALVDDVFETNLLVGRWPTRSCSPSP